MPGDTKIEWADATWNPVTGCTKVSAGCHHCYAEAFAERFRGMPGHPYEQGFDLRLWPERLGIPLRWTKPRRIFVNSMSDLFHSGVPDAFIVSVFGVMAGARQHTFLILTKRPQRMRRLLNDEPFLEQIGVLGRPDPLSRDQRPGPTSWPLPNVWLGVSVESQDVAWRIDWLARTPATVRFLSCEPLLGPLDLTPWLFPVRDVLVDQNGCFSAGPGDSLVDWVIAGGESGVGFRPIDRDWVQDLRNQCVLARVPFFFKQWGGLRSRTGGRELDGRTWDEFSVVTS